MPLPPFNPREHAQRATQLLHAGRRAEAAAVLEEAVARAPGDTHLNELLGYLAATEGRWAEAARRYDLAARGRPGDHGLALTLAKARYHAGDHGGARTLAEGLAAAGVQGARRMLGMLLAAGAEYFAAAEHLGAYLAGAGGRDLECVGALAHALKESGRADEAVALLRPHAAAADAHPRLLHLYAFTLNYAWAATAAEIGEAHRRYARALEAGARAAGGPQVGPARGPRPQRLRLGLVSGDLRRHSVACFLLPLLELLDRERFEVVCYATSAAEDAFTREYERPATAYRRVHALSPAELAAQVGADGVHVLVDLAGYTWNHRLEVFARRAAPVQVSWLGYPAPTGLGAMDFRVVDALTDPVRGGPGEVEAGERPLRIDPCMLAYRAYADAPEPNERPPGTPIVLGCLGAVQKLSPPLLALYARTLAAIPGSVLLVQHLSLAEAALREDLVRRVVAAGVKDPSRVRVEPPAPAEGSVMRAYHGVDISLDTFPYNGTTTLCESLWMGVPVVSLVGDRTAARMGLTILSRVGLGDLAVASEDALIGAVAGLAGDHARRAELRRALRGRVQATLGDAPAFARAFERAMDAAWDARRA